jgi:hypothetical protein
MRLAGRQVWRATRGEACLGTGKAARFSALVPSTARFDRLLLVAKTILSLPKPVEDAILGSKSPGIWPMSDKVSEAIAKGCLH